VPGRPKVRRRPSETNLVSGFFHPMFPLRPLFTRPQPGIGPLDPVSKKDSPFTPPVAAVSRSP